MVRYGVEWLTLTEPRIYPDTDGPYTWEEACEAAIDTLCEKAGAIDKLRSQLRDAANQVDARQPGRYVIDWADIYNPRFRRNDRGPYTWSEACWVARHSLARKLDELDETIGTLERAKNGDWSCGDSDRHYWCENPDCPKAHIYHCRCQCRERKAQ